jgi:hypothetical protein
MVAFSNYGVGSAEVISGCSLWGLASTYLLSRKGAAHPFDFSPLRKCIFTTFSWYMIGVSVGMFWGIARASN